MSKYIGVYKSAENRGVFFPCRRILAHLNVRCLASVSYIFQAAAAWGFFSVLLLFSYITP